MMLSSRRDARLLSVKLCVIALLLISGSSCTSQRTYSLAELLALEVNNCNADALTNSDFKRLNRIEKLELANTAISSGCQCDLKLTIVRTLLNEIDGSDFHDERGFTSLHLAASSDCANVIDYLIEEGHDANAANPVSGVTPLIVACNNGALDCVLVLLRNGADQAIADNSGQVAMHSAVQQDEQIVQSLLEQDNARSSVEAVDVFGLSPLFYWFIRLKRTSFHEVDKALV